MNLHDMLNFMTNELQNNEMTNIMSEKLCYNYDTLSWKNAYIGNILKEFNKKYGNINYK